LETLTISHTLEYLTNLSGPLEGGADAAQHLVKVVLIERRGIQPRELFRCCFSALVTVAHYLGTSNDTDLFERPIGSISHGPLQPSVREHACGAVTKSREQTSVADEPDQ
jgi:hypothetical protein